MHQRAQRRQVGFIKGIDANSRSREAAGDLPAEDLRGGARPPGWAGDQASQDDAEISANIRISRATATCPWPIAVSAFGIRKKTADDERTFSAGRRGRLREAFESKILFIEK